MEGIGSIIRRERKLKGLTQKEVSMLIGNENIVSVNQWENGRRNPTVESLKRIADALEIPLSRLLPPGWLPAETSHSMEFTLNEYQNAAARTINPALYPEQQLHHAIHGMAGEVGEIHSLFQKAYQGHPLDPEHLKKELGDALWMIAEGCTAMGWTLEDVAQANIAKLKARYPDGFSADRSLHRKEGDI